ncbi:MAG: hypothetical protein ACU0GG_08600 [Paracoccaceae bacterium]
MSRKTTPDKPGQGTRREDRLKAALKANLSRRKAQAAARSGDKTDKKAG